jgi:heme oxygenase
MERRTSCIAPAEHADSLSLYLRARTAPLHTQAEALLGLPDSVYNRQDYCRLLERLFGLYEPLEQVFRSFDDWTRIGLALEGHPHVARLSDDLIALGSDPRRVPRVPATMLPELPSFPHALGALYVLEGSLLGGRIILRALEPRLGSIIAGATGFFTGHGAQAGPIWQAFRATLDSFDRLRPGVREDVLLGAENLYRAMLSWFQSSHSLGASL